MRILKRKRWILTTLISAAVIASFLLVPGLPKPVDAVAPIREVISYLDDLLDVNATTPTDNQALTWDNATSTWIPETITIIMAGLPTDIKTASITFIVDGVGSAITTGEKGHLEIPFNCTIQQATMVANQTGSSVVDVWKDTYANFPPTDADNITGATPPTITTAQKSQDTTLTNWTINITSGDILAFNVDSCTNITRITLSLQVVKT